MRNKSCYLLLAVLSLLFSSCAHRLTGTWSIQKYQTISPSTQERVSLQNVGTITFKKDGTGQKRLTYNVLGIEKGDNLPFTWSATDSFITIIGKDSDLTKTWIYVENRARSQKWKSTDGKNQVQSLELVKR